MSTSLISIIKKSCGSIGTTHFFFLKVTGSNGPERLFVYIKVTGSIGPERPKTCDVFKTFIYQKIKVVFFFQTKNMIKNILSIDQFKGQRICKNNNSNIDRNVGPPGPLDPNACKRVKMKNSFECYYKCLSFAVKKKKKK